MTPKYWTVQEAAQTLGVAPPTLRRWIERGELQVRRLPGRSGHRRIPYEEVARIAETIQQNLPQCPPVSRDTSYSLADAAHYLGVSPRFLWNLGLSLRQGGMVTGADILGWENILYPAPSEIEGDLSDMSMHHKMGRGPMGAMHDGEGRHFGPWDTDWDETRPHSVLWLRSMKRHIEARMADLKDRLEWVENELAKAEQDKSQP